MRPANRGPRRNALAPVLKPDSVPQEVWDSFRRQIAQLLLLATPHAAIQAALDQACHRWGSCSRFAWLVEEVIDAQDAQHRNASGDPPRGGGPRGNASDRPAGGGAYVRQKVGGPKQPRSQLQGFAASERPPVREHPLAEQHRQERKRGPSTGGYKGGEQGGYILLGAGAELGPYTKSDVIAFMKAWRGLASARRTTARKHDTAPRPLLAIDRLAYFRKQHLTLRDVSYVLGGRPPKLVLAAHAGADLEALLAGLEDDRNYIVGHGEAGDEDDFGGDYVLEDGFDMEEARNYARELVEGGEKVKVFRAVVDKSGETLFEGVWPKSHKPLPCHELAQDIADSICDGAEELNSPAVKQRVVRGLFSELFEQTLEDRLDEEEDEDELLTKTRLRQIEQEVREQVLNAIEQAVHDPGIAPDDVIEAIEDILSGDDGDDGGVRENGGKRRYVPLVYARAGKGLAAAVRRARTNAVVFDTLHSAQKGLCASGYMRPSGRLTLAGYDAQDRLLKGKVAKGGPLHRARKAVVAARIEAKLQARGAGLGRANRSGVPLSRRREVIDAAGVAQAVAEYRPVWHETAVKDGKRVRTGRTSRPRVMVALPTKAVASQFGTLSGHVHDRIGMSLEWDAAKGRFIHRPGHDSTTYIDPAFGLAQEIVPRARLKKRAGPRGKAAARAARQGMPLPAPSMPEAGREELPTVPSPPPRQRKPKAARAARAAAGRAPSGATTSPVPVAPEAGTLPPQGARGRVIHHKRQDLARLRDPRKNAPKRGRRNADDAEDGYMALLRTRAESATAVAWKAREWQRQAKAALDAGDVAGAEQICVEILALGAGLPEAQHAQRDAFLKQIVADVGLPASRANARRRGVAPRRRR